MALNSADLAAIDAVLAASQGTVSMVATLRQNFPHISWSSCDASDIDEMPFKVYDAFDMYLLNSAEHCAEITSDPACATGIVLARRVTLT
jgi:hypothetical protein